MKGIVTKSTGSWYSVLSENGNIIACRIKGSMRLEGSKSTNPIAVGDRVQFDLEKGKETGVITSADERKNHLIRKATNLSKQHHVLAANIDQLVILATLTQPRTSTGFIDRMLITAEAYNIPAILVFNKSDLYSEENLQDAKKMCDYYKSLGYFCYITSAKEEQSLKEIKNILQNKTSLISGHSGVGKSTLLNTLNPALHLKTAPISEAHEKGMHTTTFAEMFVLMPNTYVIDSPGIKEFGVVNIEKEELHHFFPEMRTRMNQCKFNSCLHLNEPGCKIQSDVNEGKIAAWRFDTYLNIMLGNELQKTYS